MYNEELKEKGDDAERLFKEYLNKNKIPYIYFEQGILTKSDVLKTENIIRPDFLIQTDNGIFYIDVKFREKTVYGEKNEERFRLSPDKIINIHNFQSVFNQDIWLAFTNNRETPDFCFTSITSIYNFYKNLEKAYNKKQKDFSKAPFIYFPNDLILYNRLSVENGFYKELASSYYEKEAEYLIENEKKH